MSEEALPLFTQVRVRVRVGLALRLGLGLGLCYPTLTLTLTLTLTQEDAGVSELLLPDCHLIGEEALSGAL